MSGEGMELRESAKNATEQIAAILGATMSEEQRLDVINVIEKALVLAVLDARNNCAKAALGTDTPHTDLAHEISRRIHRANQVLVTNLESMR